MTSVRNRGPPVRRRGFVTPSHPSRSSGGRLTSWSGGATAAPSDSGCRWAVESVTGGRALQRASPRGRETSQSTRRTRRAPWRTRISSPPTTVHAALTRSELECRSAGPVDQVHHRRVRAHRIGRNRQLLESPGRIAGADAGAVDEQTAGPEGSVGGQDLDAEPGGALRPVRLQTCTRVPSAQRPHHGARAPPPRAPPPSWRRITPRWHRGGPGASVLSAWIAPSSP